MTVYRLAFTMNEQPIDLKPFLKRGLHYSLAEVVYRNIFEPILNLAERISAYFTRSWCEDNSLALREMKQNERNR